MTPKKLRSILCGAIVIFVLFIAGAWYQYTYPVRADQSNLDDCIARFYLRGEDGDISPNIERYDSITLEDTTFVLIDANGQLGVVILKQGPTGRYKVDSMGYGTSRFREYVLDTGDEKYYIFAGRNDDLSLGRVSFNLEDDTYTMEIPAEPNFLVYTPIDSRATSDRQDLGSFSFYDAEGTDITDSIEWSSGGIGVQIT